jgi:Mrp family chromosome partitioning ATPase
LFTFLNHRSGLDRGRIEPTTQRPEVDEEGSEAGWIEWEFTPDARRLIRESETYAVLNRQAVLGFRSSYALRLCAVIAVQDVKGGVGKSTLSVHLAQYLAIQGYRVCLIDCDSQASSTTLFGYVPDLDLSEGQTLYPFLREDDMKSLDYDYWAAIASQDVPH